MSRFAWLLVAACGSSAAPNVANTHAPAGQMLGEVLEREVGGGVPVAILPGASGLRAVSADGAHERVVVPGHTGWVLVDQRADVVWFGDDAGTIRALDLEAPAAAVHPVTVVTGLPPNAIVGIGHTRDPSTPFADLTYGTLSAPRALLVVDAEPALHAIPGVMTMVSSPEDIKKFEAAIGKATIVDKPFVAQLAKRGARRPLSLGGATPDEKLRVLTGYDPTQCQDPTICGRAELVPATKLWRVVISHGCGDGCYTTWRLYDPDARRYLDGDWTQLPADAWVARDGSAFVTGGAIYRFDRGPIAPPADEMLVGGGWLGGAYHLD